MISENIRRKWIVRSKRPSLVDIFQKDEKQVWSRFRDDEELLSNFEEGNLIFSYFEILGSLVFSALGAYGVFWKFSELLNSEYSFGGIAWLILFLVLFIWAGFHVYVSVRDIHFPSLRFKNDERFFLITNQRLLSMDGAGHVKQELPITEIAGFADIGCENTSECDEHGEDGYEKELYVSRQGQTNPFSNGFYFHHLTDKNKVINIITELTEEEI